LGACDNKLFAVAGVNQIKALSQDNGEILWQKDLSVIFNSTPICDGESVYISSSDNKTFALNVENGEIKWIHYGIAKSLAIFGSAQPVVHKDVLIASYSSGEIYAINKKTGENLWSQDLNLNQVYNSDFFLNDVDATPLVKNDVVYAIGNGGLMKAISLKTGEDIWKKSIASVVDFWLAGDFLYVINSDNKLLAVYKKTGGIKWMVQLPDFKNPKKLATKFNYIGVIMAGDKLLASREDGELFIISPFDGKIEKTFSLNKKVLHVPIIIENNLYFYGMNRYKTKLIELE
jgi:outer membrane protein assembly factor BamB